MAKQRNEIYLSASASNAEGVASANSVCGVLAGWNGGKG